MCFCLTALQQQMTNHRVLSPILMSETNLLDNILWFYFFRTLVLGNENEYGSFGASGRFWDDHIACTRVEKTNAVSVELTTSRNALVYGGGGMMRDGFIGPWKMVLTKAFNLVNTHLDPNQLYGITWYLAYYCVWCGPCYSHSSDRDASSKQPNFLVSASKMWPDLWNVIIWRRMLVLYNF